MAVMIEQSYEDDVTIARTNLDASAETLAGAWAALRSMGRYDLANRMVPLLTAVKKTLEELPAPEMVGHDPEDWYLAN